MGLDQPAFATAVLGESGRYASSAICVANRFCGDAGEGTRTLHWQSSSLVLPVAEVSATLGVKCHVYGFDTGAGLPEVTHIRDLPQLYKRGDYRMDFTELKTRLRPETQLVLGNVSETLGGFLATAHPAVGFVSMDLDLYTSTRDAMNLFRDAAPLTHCLPRVVCYLDDIMGVEWDAGFAGVQPNMPATKIGLLGLLFFSGEDEGMLDGHF